MSASFTEREAWFKETESFWKPSAYASALCTISRCRARWALQRRENYSGVISGYRRAAQFLTLLDYFEDYLLIVDESHVTLPQVRGAHGGDQSCRPSSTRLQAPGVGQPPPSFDEFNERINQVIYVSATLGEYERSRSYR